MIRQYLTNRKIKKFLSALVGTLASDYGRAEEYTEGQVKTALKKLGYSEKFEEVAIGIFCNYQIAKKFGLDDTLIKKYRGYPIVHRAGLDGGMSSGGAGDSGD